MLEVTPQIRIGDDELSESFVRSSGPGGQNVNKVASAVELRFDVAHSPSLPDAVRARLLARRDRRLTDEGVLVISASRFRDQGRNREGERDPVPCGLHVLDRRGHQKSGHPTCNVFVKERASLPVTATKSRRRSAASSASAPVGTLTTRRAISSAPARWTRSSSIQVPRRRPSYTGSSHTATRRSSPSRPACSAA